MANVQKISPCLWFDDQAESAAKFYTGIFKNSKIGRIARYGEAGKEIHGRPPGSVMTVEFQLEGQDFTALNGGPQFKFTPAMSLFVSCESQAEVDELWTKLLAGGGKPNGCGWLDDRYGVSWQIVPAALIELMSDPDPKASGRVAQALMRMQKIDIASLLRAHLAA